MSSLTIEFVGTFFLMLVVAMTGNPVAIGATLAVMIYIGAHVSGGHYNPAVTMALWSTGKLSTTKTMRYISSQILGAVAGVLIAYVLNGKDFVVAPSTGSFFYQQVIAEALFTFALVTAVFHTAVSKDAAGNSYFGLVIGMTVLIGAYTVGQISGGAFNPAVGLAPLLVSASKMHVVGVESILLYTVGPLLGGELAARFYQYTHPHDKHPEVK
ncbi:MAG: aquaporin [bacterium]